MRIAVVGTGISGLYCARLLARDHSVTLFERDARVGGHAHTVTVEREGVPVALDTGFLVFNERNYPGFTRLLDELGVASQPSEMSFSLRDDRSGVEWKPSDLNGIFAHRRQLLRARHWRMLREIPRFHRAARRAMVREEGGETVGDVLDRGGFSAEYCEQYLIPLGSAIWSASPNQFRAMPIATVGRFLDNHGLLAVRGRPTWRTVTGGSVRYLDALVASIAGDVRLSAPVEEIRRLDDGVEVTALGEVLGFDEVVVAAHAPDALRMLVDPSDAERDVLGAIAYAENDAVLHTDETLMPRSRRAWASWNVHGSAPNSGVAVTYSLNRLQRLAGPNEYFVTLNATGAIDPARIIARFAYSHPLLDAPAIAAQHRWGEINGVRRTWFCGAYWRYGFHEDGLVSGARVARALGAAG